MAITDGPSRGSERSLINTTRSGRRSAPRASETTLFTRSSPASPTLQIDILRRPLALPSATHPVPKSKGRPALHPACTGRLSIHFHRRAALADIGCPLGRKISGQHIQNRAQVPFQPPPSVDVRLRHEKPRRVAGHVSQDLRSGEAGFHRPLFHQMQRIGHLGISEALAAGAAALDPHMDAPAP